MEDEERDAPRERPTRAWYRVAFVATAMLLVAIIVTLPFSLASVVDDVLGPATGKVYPLMQDPRVGTAPTSSRLHLAVTAIDETQLRATIRVSGHHVCPAPCETRQRLLFVSVAPDDAEAEGLPPGATFLLPAAGGAVSESFHLPLRGFPIRYPFDSYDLTLAIALQHVLPDGRAETLSPDRTRRELSLSVQELLPSQIMSAPVPVDPKSVHTESNPLEFAGVWGVSFERPRYLRVLTLMLVVLTGAAATYSVFLRPLADLVVNAGALVVGIWGIRAILTPGNLYYLTAVDLALSTVILFLLGAITVKALMLSHDRGQLNILRRPLRRRGVRGR